MEKSQGVELKSERRDGNRPKDRASTRTAAPDVTPHSSSPEEESFALGWNHGVHRGCVVKARNI